jgi:HD superfamily phosphodiesterase
MSSEGTRFPSRLSLYAATLFAVCAASAALFGLSEGVPPLGAVAFFGAVVVFSSHRSVQLPNGITMTTGLMIFMAAIVVFRDEQSFLAVLIVGALEGIHVSSFKRSTWGWIPFNAGVCGLALLASAWAFALVPNSVVERMPWGIASAVLPAVVFTAVCWAFIVLSYVIEQGRPPREVVLDLGPSFVQALPFAVLGFLLGRLYLSLGPAVLLLIIVPILIAREMFASYMRVKESHEETVHMLIRALEQKDHYTAGHAERVATYARYIGEELSFMPARLERLRFAALMHDIGKLVVPNQLLNKPSRLTPEEFAKVRIHEKVSVQMLSHIDFLRPIAGASHSDNTRFDPDDPDHPIEPYIVMIADAYDAMTSTRAYRKALTQEVAFQELRDKAGIQFHPQCVEALIHAVERRGEKHGAGYEQQSEFTDAPDAGLGSAGLGDLLDSEHSHSQAS